MKTICIYNPMFFGFCFHEILSSCYCCLVSVNLLGVLERSKLVRWSTVKFWRPLIAPASDRLYVRLGPLIQTVIYYFNDKLRSLTTCVSYTRQWDENRVGLRCHRRARTAKRACALKHNCISFLSQVTQRSGSDNF